LKNLRKIDPFLLPENVIVNLLSYALSDEEKADGATNGATRSELEIVANLGKTWDTIGFLFLPSSGILLLITHFKQRSTNSTSLRHFTAKLAKKAGYYNYPPRQGTRSPGFRSCWRANSSVYLSKLDKSFYCLETSYVLLLTILKRLISPLKIVGS